MRVRPRTLAYYERVVMRSSLELSLTCTLHVNGGSLSTNHKLAPQTHHQMAVDDEFVKPIRG